MANYLQDHEDPSSFSSRALGNTAAKIENEMVTIERTFDAMTTDNDHVCFTIHDVSMTAANTVMVVISAGVSV